MIFLEWSSWLGLIAEQRNSNYLLKIVSFKGLISYLSADYPADI